MNHLAKKWLSASVLASTIGPLTALSCLAKDLSPADLARMGEASAVRIGCGVTIGVAEMSAVAATGPNVVGALACSALILAAVRFLPKRLREPCWKLLRLAAVTYFWLAVPVLLLSNTSALFQLGIELWIGSSLIAVPAMIGKIVKTILTITRSYIASRTIHSDRLRSLDETPAQSPVNSDALSIKVEGNTVTLRHGNQSETRVIENLAIAEANADEGEPCQIR